MQLALEFLIVRNESGVGRVLLDYIYHFDL